jgi:transposase
MIRVDDLTRSLIAYEQIGTLVIAVELSQSNWLAAGVVPGIERRPLKKLQDP